MVRIYKDNQNVCKLIAELTGTDKKTARDILERLEKKAALPGVDVRLSGEIYGRVHSKMRELGLDPRDTTARELYQSLINLAARHDIFLAKRIGVKRPDNAADVATAIENYIKEAKIPKEALALKPAAIRRLLKAMPPKNLMKALHYRSVESMLKRESPVMLLTVARHFEPLKWQERLVHLYKKLGTNDFETRNIDVLHLTGKHWQSVGGQFSQSRRNNILHAPEAAGIALLPLDGSNRKGITLASLLLTLHYISETRSLSTYFKFHHMRPNFGARLAEQVIQNKQHHIHMAGQPVHWNVVHRYYGSNIQGNHPEIFEPHVQPEDLAYRKAEEILYRLEPALHFWYGLDYVGLPTETGPISFSMTDMAMNLVNNLSYEKRVHYHLREAMWNELYLRYAAFPAIEQHVLGQLEEQTASIRPLFPVALAQHQASEVGRGNNLIDLFIIEDPVKVQRRRASKKRQPTIKTFDMEFVW